MMKRLIAWGFGAWFVVVPAGAGPADDDYKAKLEKLGEEKERINTAYRAAVSKESLAATKVEIFIVSPHDVKDAKPVKLEDGEDRIRIAPSHSTTEILLRQELTGGERKELLAAFSRRVAESRHIGGALCHDPIHGLRIHSGETLLYSGTFCWKCGNFSFRYPDGSSEWLDTNEELRVLFTKSLPIPDEQEPLGAGDREKK